MNASVVAVAKHDGTVDERHLFGSGQSPGVALDLDEGKQVRIPHVPSRDSGDVDDRVVHELHRSERKRPCHTYEMVDVLDRFERHLIEAPKERVDPVVESPNALLLGRE